MDKAEISLFIDECVHAKLAAALVTQGYDAVHAQDVGRKGMGDEEQLEYATAHGRTLVSYNAVDLDPIHRTWLAEGREHCGILLSPDRKGRLSVLLTRITARIAGLDEIKNNYVWF